MYLTAVLRLSLLNFSDVLNNCVRLSPNIRMEKVDLKVSKVSRILVLFNQCLSKSDDFQGIVRVDVTLCKTISVATISTQLSYRPMSIVIISSVLIY